MSNQDTLIETAEPKETPKRNLIYRTVRTLTLASVGAISISREEIKRLLDRLVARGELDAKQARKLLREADVKGRAQQKRARAQRKENALSSSEIVSLPTHAELAALQQQLARLNAELKELHSLTIASTERQAD